MDCFSSPLVSIIMNCYNGEKYLREAIESVIAQTYKNWELIFWDNRSADQSADIIQSYDDERFRYFYAPKHTLLYEARNYALEKASGEFFAFLDVDDWWVPEKLEKQLPLFVNPEVGLVYGNYWFENEQKGSLETTFNEQLPFGFIMNDLLKKYVVGLLTIVIRRTAFESLDHPFDPRYHIIGDFDLVIRMARKWQLTCVQSPVATYRYHQNNESNMQKERNLYEMGNWLDEMRDSYEKSSQEGFYKKEEQYLYMKGISLIEQNNPIKALRIFWSIPLGMKKLKLLISLILPNFLLNLLRTE